MTFEDTISLLRQLIRTPSFSREESAAADIVIDAIRREKLETRRIGNNVWTALPDFQQDKPTVLLNSHLDTVKPASGWSVDPHAAHDENGKITGLGSNDAGGSLVALLHVFTSFRHIELPFNLIFAASAEEEISGPAGMELLRSQLPAIDFAVVGEPTSCRLAIAERGLMVVDCTSHGRSGHAARDEGDNAIATALKDLNWLQSNPLTAESESLGLARITATIIHAGSQHNVVPDKCDFTLDVRSTDVVSNVEILEYLRANLRSEVNPRSTRLEASGVPAGHPILRAAEELGIETYGSPTLSDQALMPWPSVKIGPGESSRSHTPDEYILVSEIASCIDSYTSILKHLADETLG